MTTAIKAIMYENVQLCRRTISPVLLYGISGIAAAFLIGDAVAITILLPLFLGTFGELLI